jgi:hypothetical protein
MSMEKARYGGIHLSSQKEAKNRSIMVQAVLDVK